MPPKSFGCGVCSGRVIKKTSANDASVKRMQETYIREGETLAAWLPAIRIVQIILSIAVIFFILLQVRGAGLGSAFGGSSAGSVFKTRRGVERLVFNITIAFVILFAIISVLSMIIHV